MATFHFQTHVSDSRVITLPLLPETFYGEHVTVKVDVNSQLQPIDDDWPTPTDELEKMYTMCRGVLEGMTPEDFERLREERIMGIKR